MRKSDEKVILPDVIVLATCRNIWTMANYLMLMEFGIDWKKAAGKPLCCISEMPYIDSLRGKKRSILRPFLRFRFEMRDHKERCLSMLSPSPPSIASAPKLQLLIIRRRLQKTST